MTEKSSNGKSFLLGALIGGVAGAISGLLFAPKAGRELRGEIKEQAQVIGEKTLSVAGDVKDRTQSVVKSVSSRTSGLFGKNKEPQDELTESMPDSLAGQDEANEIKSQIN